MYHLKNPVLTNVGKLKERKDRLPVAIHHFWPGVNILMAHSDLFNSCQGCHGSGKTKVREFNFESWKMDILMKS